MVGRTETTAHRVDELDRERPGDAPPPIRFVFGFAGLVDGIVGRMVAELAEAPTVIATGGLAAVIAPLCEAVDEVDPYLTLVGLRLIHERN